MGWWIFHIYFAVSFIASTVSHSQEEDGHFLLHLSERIPFYSGQRMYMQNCTTDDVGFQIVKDLQMSPTMKAKWLNANSCRREANLMCDHRTKTCKCINFGGTPSVWDRVRVRCISKVGSKCRTFTMMHPGMRHRYVHKPECTPGASCEDLIYDTQETCKCNEDLETHRTTCGKMKSASVSAFQLRFSFFCVVVTVVEIFSWSGFKN